MVEQVGQEAPARWKRTAPAVFSGTRKIHPRNLVRSRAVAWGRRPPECFRKAWPVPFGAARLLRGRAGSPVRRNRGRKRWRVGLRRRSCGRIFALSDFPLFSFFRMGV